MLRMTILGTLFALIGCKHLASADKDATISSYDNLGALAPIACQDGELMAFHLEDQGVTPQVSEIKFVPGKVEEEYALVKPSKDLNVRLDMCVNEKALQLRRIVYLSRPDRPVVTLTPNRFSVARGLDDAIFRDEHAGVWVEVSFGSQEDGYLLRGWKKGQDGFLTFTPVRRHAEGTVVPKEANLLFGKLVYGDPWQ